MISFTGLSRVLSDTATVTLRRHGAGGPRSRSPACAWPRPSGRSCTRRIPNYDSYYSLLWGRELLHGHQPHFEGFRHPTEHPLAIVAGAILDLFGGFARPPLDHPHPGRRSSRWWPACTGWRRRAFTPLVGLVAALLLLSRFDFAFLAVRGYIDIPYLALVVWAVALEAATAAPGHAGVRAAGRWRACSGPRAGCCSASTGCGCSRGATWRERALFAAVAAIAPARLGARSTGIVTGDPLFSLHYTSDSAEDLGPREDAQRDPGRDPRLPRRRSSRCR